MNKKFKIYFVLQDIAKQISNAFTDSERVTKSYMPTVNAPARIEVQAGQSTKIIANESIARQKGGGATGLKD
jgi:hypothetical protein